MDYLVLGLVAATFVGLLFLNSGGATREGSYRRGAGWYFDASTPRDILMRGRVAIPPPSRVPAWSIRVWGGAGGAFLAGAIVVWVVLGSPGLAIFVGVVGALEVALAWDGARRNRRLDRDREDENTDGTSAG